MAAPLLKGARSCRKWNARHMRVFYRTLLSEDYKCDVEWQYRLESKFLTNMQPRPFGYDLLRRFEKEKYISPMDIELFANRIQDLKATDDEMIEDVIYKFRHTDDSVPINDCIHHTLVRAYIESDRVDRLLFMMKDKVRYGIFPDFQAFCLLIDHLIERKDFEGACHAANEVMLQEDFSHPLCNLLCVYAITQCYKGKLFEKKPTDQEVKTVEGEEKKEEEEMEYIPVKIIWNPYYDDHFDMKDNKLLLGKSLYYFGKYTKELNEVDSRSLQLIGLALYEKFDIGLRLLEFWIKESSLKEIIHEEASKVFHDSLHKAAVRDPDTPSVPMGQKTLDDCLEEMKLTEIEKENLIKRYEPLHQQLSQHGLVESDLVQSIVKTVGTLVLDHEESDIKIMKENYHSWIMRRQKLLPRYMTEHLRSDKMREIRQKLMVLQEKEELLSYFKNEHIIGPYVDKRTRKIKKKEEEKDTDADEYVEAPGERNIRKGIMKK